MLDRPSFTHTVPADAVRDYFCLVIFIARSDRVSEQDKDHFPIEARPLLSAEDSDSSNCRRLDLGPSCGARITRAKWYRANGHKIFSFFPYFLFVSRFSFIPDV